MKTSAACLMIVWLAGCAKVAVLEPAAKNTAEASSPAMDNRLELKAPVTAPFAFTHFCLRYSDECRVHDAKFEGGQDIESEIADVNNQVNGTITPGPERARIGFDAWRIAPPVGDCNDYAVTKRHELLDRGWPSRSLLLAEVVTRKGEHHLVLVVRSGAKDVVLDNLTSDIREWSETPYDWVRVQSPDNPENWLSVANA